MAEAFSRCQLEAQRLHWLFLKLIVRYGCVDDIKACTVVWCYNFCCSLYPGSLLKRFGHYSLELGLCTESKQQSCSLWGAVMDIWRKRSCSSLCNYYHDLGILYEARLIISW